jgi:hypothetical protein
MGPVFRAATQRLGQRFRQLGQNYRSARSLTLARAMVTTKRLASSELCFPVSENAVRRIFGERDELNAPAVEDYPLHPDPMDGEPALDEDFVGIELTFSSRVSARYRVTFCSRAHLATVS